MWVQKNVWWKNLLGPKICLGLNKILGPKKMLESLPTKVVFHQRLSSIEGCLPSKVILHWRVSFNEVRLPSKAIFHQKLSSIKGCFHSKVVFVFTIKLSIHAKFHTCSLLVVRILFIVLIVTVVKLLVCPLPQEFDKNWRAKTFITVTPPNQFFGKTNTHPEPTWGAKI